MVSMESDGLKIDEGLAFHYVWSMWKMSSYCETIEVISPNLKKAQRPTDPKGAEMIQIRELTTITC